MARMRGQMWIVFLLEINREALENGLESNTVVKMAPDPFPLPDGFV